MTTLKRIENDVYEEMKKEYKQRKVRVKMFIVIRYVPLKSSLVS